MHGATAAAWFKWKQIDLFEIQCATFSNCMKFPLWHREDIDEAYAAGMCSYGIWWAQRATYICRMYHLFTDPTGPDRLYKPKEGEVTQLFLRVADEYERVYKHFNANDEIGIMRPTATEMHVLTSA
eukprot:535128-Amphidinium_carterae.1